MVETGTVQPNAMVTLYNLTIPNPGTDPTIVITLEPASHGNVDLYCNSAGSSSLPSPLVSQFSAAREGPLSDTVVMTADSLNYGDGTGTSPNMTCLLSNASPSGPAVPYTLTVFSRGNETSLVADQADAASLIFQQCCANPTSCQAWRSLSVARGVDVSGDLCGLDGSFCSVDGELEQLDLSSMGLSCSFPAAQLAAFAGLQTLLLNDNDLWGSFPAAMSSLAASLLDLETLDLSGNADLSGDAGGESGGLCILAQAGLRDFAAEGNSVSGSVPACLLNATSSLYSLRMANNSLFGALPEAAGSGSSLWTLDLSGNGLSGTLPATLAAAPDLQLLALGNNTLAGPVPEAAYQNLTRLSLPFNDLTGALPASLAGHARLAQLDARNNRLRALPAGWVEDAQGAGAAAAPLQHVELRFNEINSSFPAGLSEYPSLSFLSLADNDIGGSLPEQDGAFSALRTAFLARNAIEGTVPESWNETAIFAVPPNRANDNATWGTLDLSSNDMSGELPVFLSSLTYPVNILLSGNAFSNACDAAFNNVGGVCSGADAPPPPPPAPPGPNPWDPATWSDSLGAGAKWGIALGVLAAVGLAILGVVLCLRRRRERDRQGPTMLEGGGRFSRFEDEAGLEMSRPGTQAGWGAPPAGAGAAPAPAGGQAWDGEAPPQQQGWAAPPPAAGAGQDWNARPGGNWNAPQGGGVQGWSALPPPAAQGARIGTFGEFGSENAQPPRRDEYNW